MTPRLSLIVIARNESKDLPGCLESCSGLADEVVVVDDFSDDDTLELARRLGAKVFQRRLDSFGAQKQYALDQATGEWVLSLDADERLTPALKTEIAETLSSPAGDGYRIRRENYFLGREMRHSGLARDSVLRLFRRASGRFTNSDVHESVELRSPVGALRQPLLHRPYESLSDYVSKMDLYTTLAARQAYREGKRFRIWDHARLPLEFLKRYFLQLGLLDGSSGFVWSVLCSFYVWLKRLKLREMDRTPS